MGLYTMCYSNHCVFFSVKFGKKDIAVHSLDKDPKTNDLKEMEYGIPNQPTVVLLGSEKGVSGGPRATCAKHDLKVAFEDIGWDHWVIAPKSFAAHYCAGPCPFPLTPVRITRGNAVARRGAGGPAAVGAPPKPRGGFAARM